MRTFSLAMFLALAAVQAADTTATVEAKDFAAQLGKPAQVAVFQVGFGYLYRANHIPGSVYAGPGSRPDGIELLKKAAANLPHDREIVIYCGCCPWDKCPNIDPVIKLLKDMGFAHVKALHLPTNFKTDWIDQHYPTEKGDAPK